MTEATDPEDNLDDNWKDRLVAAAKGALSFVPAGGLVAEIVGTIVPGQRADRIAAYLRGLAAKFEGFEQEMRQAIVGNADRIDLIEEGGYQAARATSQERIAQIVEAVRRGLGEDDADVIRRKRLLRMLGELDDDEVALLNAYGQSYGGGDREAFLKINRPDPPSMQSDAAEVERDRLYTAGKEHLVRLGLLKKNYGTVKKDQLPAFDTRNGDFKHTVEISHLGRMLLKEIGMATPFDQQQARD